VRPRDRKLTLTAAALAAAAVGVAALRAYLVKDRRGPDEAAFEIVRTNVPAPEITLTGPDARTFHLEQAKGQVLFINFWATWCPPCREEMPSMVDLAQELTRSHPGKFRMVAVSADDSWEDVRRYFKQVFGGIPADITVARDPAGKAALAYYCSARGVCPDIKFPETYIVDGSGRLVAYIVSSRDWSAPVARRFLERLISR
jgi:thiol-disulfide isomerase/thioredoxin